MKKSLLIILPCLFMSLALRAQEGTVHDKGTIFIDAYYGYPNGFSTLFRIASGEAYYSNVSVTSIGPVGGKVEYMLSPKFGLGANVVYAKSTWSFHEETGGTNPAFYSTTLTVPRLRVMATWNVHLSKSEKLDTYIGGGLGYSTLHADLVTNDPAFDLGEYRLQSTFPIAFRVFEFGIRYFFIENVGVNWQIGLGAGALTSAGISARF